MKLSTIEGSKKLLYGILKSIAIIVFWVLVWYVFYIIIDRDLLIVSPFEVVHRLAVLCADVQFWVIASASMARILSGFLAGVAFGVVLAVVTSCLPLANDLFKPIVSVIKATPVASFIILALVWMKTGSVPSFISFLMVLPIVWGNVTQAIVKTDSKLLEMAKVYNFGTFNKVQMIYTPAVTPYFIAACTTALGLAWKAGIAAEVISGTNVSIGQQIYSAKQYLDTLDLFAWTVVVIILSVILERLMVFAMKRISTRYSFSMGGGSTSL